MAPCEKGRIHSIESFGTVDGPGVRMVVFFQGCPMRCLYCHNPDTWSVDGGCEMTVDEILSAYERNKSFYRGGGLTATGGEPLVQLPFLTALFRAARQKGIHTCLDTSGIVYRPDRRAEFDALFACTDLVLLDVKHADPEGPKHLTGHGQAPVLAFARALSEAGVPLVVRHVVVPGLTDSEEELRALGRLIAPLRTLKGLEVLPYHTMGRAKYDALGLAYPLEGIPPLEQTQAHRARGIILEEIRRVRTGEG